MFDYSEGVMNGYQYAADQFRSEIYASYGDFYADVMSALRSEGLSGKNMQYSRGLNDGIYELWESKGR